MSTCLMLEITKWLANTMPSPQRYQLLGILSVCRKLGGNRQYKFKYQFTRLEKIGRELRIVTHHDGPFGRNNLYGILTPPRRYTRHRLTR